MEMKLDNGNYVPDETGGFETVDGANETMQRILMKLKARRGAFPLMPEFGSRLYLLGREKPAARRRAAEQYVNEALRGEAVTVQSVSVSETGGTLTVNATFAAENAGEFTVSLDV